MHIVKFSIRILSRIPSEFHEAELSMMHDASCHINATAACRWQVLLTAHTMSIDWKTIDIPCVEWCELEVKRPLSDGGFSTVYEGLYQGNPVAVKKWRISDRDPDVWN